MPETHVLRHPRVQSREDIPSLPAVEDNASGPEAEVGSSVFSESAGKTVPSAADSGNYRAHAQPGMLLV